MNSYKIRPHIVFIPGLGLELQTVISEHTFWWELGLNCSLQNSPPNWRGLRVRALFASILYLFFTLINSVELFQIYLYILTKKILARNLVPASSLLSCSKFTCHIDLVFIVLFLFLIFTRSVSATNVINTHAYAVFLFIVPWKSTLCCNKNKCIYSRKH